MMKKTLFAALALLVVVSFAAPMASTPVEAAKKLTKAQRKDLHKRALDWCRKRIGGGASVEHIDIKSDGKVVCYYRG
jgi:uncharacterized protein (DUF2147 family)